MTNPSLTRYELQLDVLERDVHLADRAANSLLASEFALALNASHFSGLSRGDIAVDVRSREIPQDGVSRYIVALVLEERTPQMTDEQATELVRREFQRALNASYFLRISAADFRPTLVSRTLVVAAVALRG